jgi:hypothetical protein
MNNFLMSFGAIIAFMSIISFLFGIVRLIFIADDKKLSLKIILYSVIAFVVGFGTCAANFSLGGMH